ncbi:hypothetical protein BDR04DRAFT_1144059 [Suillus decipiens]|nr:hypothetical protein BDR04DRAFT_1144059 [Suillus decipiens]
MALKLEHGTIRSSIRGFLAGIFRPIMELPRDAPGLFSTGDFLGSMDEWQILISCSDLSQRCQLERVVFCKCTTGREHEFLLLHFRHPIQQHAIAVLVLDRIIPDYAQENNDSSTQVTQPSSIFPTRIVDRTFSTPYGSSAARSYSSRIYAIQVSVLFSILKKHPVYDLNQSQCYWYPHTVWEVLKKLFPDCRATMQHEGRSCCLGLKMEKSDGVEVVCEQYRPLWEHTAKNVAEETQERVRVMEDSKRQCMMEFRAKGWTQCPAEFDQAQARKTEATSGEAARGLEEATRKLEEATRKLNEATRGLEEATRRLNEATRGLEEATRKAEERNQRVRAKGQV